MHLHSPLHTKVVHKNQMLTLPFEESLPKMPESPSIRSGSFPQLDTCGSRANKPRLLHQQHQHHDTNHQLRTALLHQHHDANHQPRTSLLHQHHDTNHQPRTSLLMAVKPTEDQLLESESNRGDEEEEEDEDEGFQGLQQDENGVPRRQRGPRKKMSRARQDRIKLRRMEANTRERNRMHGLNNALDSLRKVVPCYSKTQKLSKIETLRLAKNYIWALSEILSTGKRPDLLTFVQTLCRGISQPTTNLVAGCLQLNARNFIMAEQDAFAGRSPFEALYPPYHHHHLHHHHHHHHSGDGESVPGVDKPFRPYGAYYDTFYESTTSPERSNSSPPIFDARAAAPPAGTLSPPLNFNGIFSLKHEEGGVRDYGKSSCHYGAALRYCAVPASTGGRGASGALHSTASRGGSATADIHPYDVHLRGQFYPLNDDINTPFHD